MHTELLRNHHPAASSGALTCCPFREGKETIDLLLAELREGKLLDAALDLRSLLDTRDNAEACVGQLFRVRRLLDERHYLAFYRVRCWMRRLIYVQVRPDRRTPWTTAELPLGGARFDEVVNSCLAAVAIDGVIPPMARVRFVFADSFSSNALAAAA